MKKSPLRDFLERLFPSSTEQKSKTSELVERSLEALRRARNDGAFSMGNVTRVPSRMELRLPQDRYDGLVQIGALRDLTYFLTDELMKDLDAEGLRTFGDHAVRVTVAVDSSLQSNELYGIVLSPDVSSSSGASSAPAASVTGDSTRALGQDSATTTVSDSVTQAIGASEAPVTYRLSGTGPDAFAVDRPLESTQWIVGRFGSVQNMPSGYSRLELNVRQTISRAQIEIVIEDLGIRIKRIGKASVTVDSQQLQEGEERRIDFAMPFYIEDYKFVITR